MIRIVAVAFLGLIIIAVLIGIYIWLGKAERRENLAQKLENVAQTGDEALLVLLAGAQSDEEKEELLRFAESGEYRAVKAAETDEQSAEKPASLQSNLTAKEPLAEQQALEQAVNDQESQPLKQVQLPNKLDLEALPIFDKTEQTAPTGVQAAVDELMRQAENGEQAKTVNTEPLNNQPQLNDLNEDTILTALYDEKPEDETIIF